MNSPALPTLPMAPPNQQNLASEQAATMRAIRSWRVLHTCENSAALATVLEIQVAAGMRPSLLLPEGLLERERWAAGASCEAAGRKSLLAAWHDVRHWRRAILDADPHHLSEIVHAHTFASGMAAVRNCPAVVYDLTGFVEERDGANGQPEGYSWLGRSFRVAEQFVLARAGAVIVHTRDIYAGAVKRGVAPENIFVIEPLLAPAAAAEKYDAAYRLAFSRRRAGDPHLLGSRLQPITACL
ncbi:MAG: hypothetical protein JOY79_03765 [Acidobacteriaceae bacterium]|nr:hypothetical protein [Acidobacteriaceae bacterium]